jgi:hypothetical protein
MFRFVIKHLGFLKAVPLLPHLFDAQLRLWTLFTNAAIANCLDDIEAEILAWENTSVVMHKYGGTQFNCNGKEMGHIHSNGLLDMLFNRKIKQELMLEGRIEDHHSFINSGWISFYIRKREDIEYAIELLRIAYLKMNKKQIMEV